MLTDLLAFCIDCAFAVLGLWCMLSDPRDGLRVAVGAGLEIVAALLLLAVLTDPANARWRAEYADADQATRNWYEAAELTPAAQRRLPFKSCCAHSDVVRTKFWVDKTTGADEWYWLNPMTKQYQRIPPDIIHWGEKAPDGQATLFVLPGTSTETCFYPGDGGI